MIFRTGALGARNAIYLQAGDAPADGDALVGSMTTPQLALFLVKAGNAAVRAAGGVPGACGSTEDHDGHPLLSGRAGPTGVERVERRCGGWPGVGE
jgi:hypothetical protein